MITGAQGTSEGGLFSFQAKYPLSSPLRGALMKETLAQIKAEGARGFTAAIVLWDDKVVETAPIVRRALKGRSRDYVRQYCASRGWQISVVHELERARP